LDLQSRNIKDPLVKSVFTESKQRIQAISFAHQRLYGNDTVEKLHLKSFLHDLVQSIESSTLNNSSLIKIETVIEDIIITTEKAVPIGLIVNELLTNAIKYAFNENTSGIIKITLSKKNDLLELCIEDNGSGMKEEIQGTGFGHQLVKSLIRQLKAEYLLSLTSGVKHQLLIAIS
jgi:two-component sensor histidine kinase